MRDIRLPLSAALASWATAAFAHGHPDDGDPAHEWLHGLLGEHHVAALFAIAVLVGVGLWMWSRSVRGNRSQ